MCALRLAGTLAGSGGVPVLGTLIAADLVLLYGELPRARWCLVGGVRCAVSHLPISDLHRPNCST